MEKEKITYDRNRLLGKGGYNAVFVGMFNGKEVAVKRIEHHNRYDDKEEKVLRILDHPNVVKLLGTNEDDYFRFYAFDLCIGSLDKIFYRENDAKKYRGPPLPRPIKLLLQLSRGLAYIHSKKLVHRDIKPENVLISIDCNNKGEVLLKWADFGLSKEVSENGTFAISEARGTLFWMAPEILACFNQSKESDCSLASIYQKGSTQSDVFSAGCLFFKIVTAGCHPFGDNIATDVPPNIKASNPVNLLNEKLLPPSHFSRDIIVGMLKQEIVDRLSINQVVHRIQEEMYNELSNICAIGEPSESDVNQLVMLVNDKDCPDLITGGKVGCKTCKPWFTPLELLCLFNRSKNLKHCIEILLKIGTSNMDQSNDCHQERNYQTNQESPNGTRALDYLCKYYEHDDLIDVIKLLIKHTRINFGRPTLRPNEVFQKVLWNASLDRDLNPLVREIALRMHRPSELLDDSELFDRQDLVASDILKTHFVHCYPEITKNDTLLSLEDFFDPVHQRYSSRVRFKYERFEVIDDNPESRGQFVSDLEGLVEHLQFAFDNIDLDCSNVITSVFRSLFGNTKWRTPANKNQSASNKIVKQSFSARFLDKSNPV